MKTRQSLKMIYDLEEVLKRIPISDFVQNYKNIYPERYNLAIEMTKFLLTTTLCREEQINKSRKIRLISTPQHEMQKFLNKELLSIGKSIEAYEEPLKDCIAEALLRHKRYLEHIENNENDNELFKNVEYEFRSWHILLIRQFSLNLCVLKPRQFDDFSFKVQLNNNERELRGGVKRTAILFNSIDNNTLLKGIKSAFESNPLKDEIVSDLKSVSRLLREHQILTEYNHYLRIDENFNYEDFINGIIPEMPNNSKLITGLKTTLSDSQIINLYDRGKKEFIKTDFQNLVNLLRGKNCMPIEWKYYHGKNSNKLALRAFINVIFNYPKNPKTIGKQYFTDKTGKPIELSKPVKNHNYDAYIDDFNKMIEKNN